MKIDTLQLVNFRNYSQVQLDFSDSINIFLGENAQGKTNLLESIYVLALTKSHRTNQEKELVNFESKEALLAAKISRRTGNFSIEVKFTTKGRQTKVNHIQQKKLSEYIGAMNVILFAPEDLEIVKGSPSVRRKFLDMELSQMNPIYLYDLMEYQKLLKQRNLYFKQMFEKKKALDELYLDILEEQLAEFGTKVIIARKKFIEQLSVWAKNVHSTISGNREELKLSYLQTVKATDDVLVENYIKQLKETRSKDARRFTTSIGPHREDLLFYVNDLYVSRFGSQGQQRTSALSVKLAEIDLMKEFTGEYPILLLDDVMSELDNERQVFLLQAILGKTQTFVTTTTLDHLKDLNVPGKIFYVENGKIINEKTI
ncbi:MAG: DNA replication/repair protein RecF [Streptococcaceae bacterium]|jgi:DNA replication and repair protein RecF|nr:DNA replication/repair protein RecF [Streptococcaceae bacterium]